MAHVWAGSTPEQMEEETPDYTDYDASELRDMLMDDDLWMAEEALNLRGLLDDEAADAELEAKIRDSVGGV